MGVGMIMWREEYLWKYNFSIFLTLSICKKNIYKKNLLDRNNNLADVTFLSPLLLKEIDIIEEGISIFKIWKEVIKFLLWFIPSY